MTEWAKLRERHARNLEHNLEQIIQQLGNISEVHRVILIGSSATGRRDLLTDLDLLVIMDSHLDFVARCADLAGRLRADVALDLLVYTPAEFEAIQDRPFFRQALKSGKVLYERK
jgi:predicted nucleotidyltransferase